MASLINVTPASQVANVEVNNRELTVTVQKEAKLVDIIVETRGNINVDISRSIAVTGVQKIVAGDNITISPSNGVGNVTISAVQSGNVEHANTANIANVANVAYSVSGSNVSGYVANATHANIADSANSVAGANVTGTVANATYATTAGSATVANSANSVSGSNVSGAVNLATYATTANSVAGANVSGSVANATHANTSTYANIALSANSVAGANVTGQVSYAAVANSVAGANVTGTVGNSIHSNVSDLANSVAGANVTGTVATANYSAYTGNVTIAGQANITSLGTLTGLTVNGQTELGSISNVHITGGSAGYVISTDGLGNLSWTAGGTGNGTPGGSNTQVQYNDNGNFAGSSSFTFNNTNNTLTVGNIVANGAQLTNLTGANVTGYVSDATHANISDSANNVSGSNVTGAVANATYATSAGSATTAVTVTASNQPNITSLGTLTSLDVTGNISSLANISGGYIFGDGSYLTGIGNLSAARGYWGSFYSNVSQTISSTTTAYPIALNNTDPDSYGVYISNSSRINFQFAGTFNLQFSAQFVNTNTAIVEASVWLRKNGVDVADTRGACAITDKQGGINGQIIESWNYILKLNAGDYLELVWQAENTSVSLEYLPGGTTPTTPASPSIIVTAQQVTNVQPVELQGNMSGNIIGNGFSLINIASISSLDGITGNTFTGNGAPLTNLTGANVTGYVPNATHANTSAASDVAYSVSGANVSGDVSGANHANIADSANSVAGANVSGEVSFANTANAVAGGNVSGAVALATYADSAGSVNGSNVSGAVNLANFATTANSVAGANVTGTVSLASHADVADSANSVAGANVSGEVSFAATANSVAGGNVSGQVSNALVAGTVYTNAQPNITSLGNLTSLNVDGNVDVHQVLYVGNGASNTIFTNPTFIGKTLGSTFIQAALINGDANGSADWVAYGDSSDDTQGWMDMGFTGSTFSDPLYSITKPNDGYIFSQGMADGSGGNIVIATGNQGNGTHRDIVFATGGFADVNEVMRVNHETKSLQISTTTAAANSASGALEVAGGVGIGGDTWMAGNLNVNGITKLGSVSNVQITGGSNSQVLTTDGAGNLSWTTVSGGGGTPGGANTQVQFNDGGSFGGSANLTFDKTTNTLSATNITGNGSGLTSITGANVTGTVANATYAVTSESSTNATVANTVIVAGATGTTEYIAMFDNSTGNLQAKTDSTLTYNASTGQLNATSFVGNANASSLTTGTVPSARVVGSYSNITRVGTLDNLDVVMGSITSSNPITLTQTWNLSSTSFTGIDVNITTTQYAAASRLLDLRANSSSKFSVDANGVLQTGNIPGTRVSGTVANATFAVTAAIANSVAVANVSGIGNIATLNLDGSSGNVLYGNGVFAPASGGGGGSPGGSNTQIQFNDGGSFGGSANLTFDKTTNTFTATNIVGNGSGLTSLTGSNVTGTVANATYATSAGSATTAGTVTTAAQPNITSTGTLTGVTVDGISNLGAVGNVIITGGTSGYVLSTNGSGNLSWVAQSGGGGGTTGFEQTFLLMGA